MNRIATGSLIVFVLSLANTTRLAAQSLTADQFLNRVSAHPVGDQAERNQAGRIALALKSAPRSEIERELPAILAHATTDKQPSVRGYAALCLLITAMRPDGAALLSSSPDQVAALLLDTSPAVQNAAAGIADYLIGHDETNRKPYLSDMETALERPQTQQNACVNIITPLLLYGPREPGAVQAVLDFIERPDLILSTRLNLVHSLGSQGGLPEEVNKALVRVLDDPDPRVRAQAVVDFADSTTEYHALARDRVAQMANDPQENPQVRELAKEATAGKTHLDPNIGLPPPENPPPRNPN